MFLLLCDFFNTIINTLFRDVPPALKAVLILVFLMLAFFSLAKTLKANSKPEEIPINVGWLLLTILFFVLMMLYIWL